MALDTVLTALAQGFQIALDASQAAQRRFVVDLLPPAGSTDQKGNISVIDLVTETQIVPAPVDMNWRTKDVRFETPDILDPLTEGGMPINGLLALNVATVTNGAPLPPGVPGLLGILAGTLPLPIDVTSPVSFSVTVDVRWHVRDEFGGSVSDVQWSLDSPAFSATGPDFSPPFGRATDAATLIFDLVFAELTSSVALTAKRKVWASIRLQAGGVSTGWIDTPALDLDLPVIPVPTIAIFCQDTNFESNKLVVVPASSPLDRATVQAAVDTLRGTLDPLRATFSFLGIFLDAAATVAGLLASTSVTFRKADEISNLNSIDLESGILNDTEAEDELSSLVMVGPPHRQIQCFNKRSFETGQGQMNVTLDHHLIASVASTHDPSPTSDPVGRVNVPFPPAGTRWSTWDPWRDITGFGDEFSSIRFSWE